MPTGTTIIDTGRLVLNPGDTLYGQCTVANHILCTVSGSLLDGPPA